MIDLVYLTEWRIGEPITLTIVRRWRSPECQRLL
jgi:hypothetical protein